MTTKSKFYLHIAILFTILFGILFSGWFVLDMVEKDSRNLTALKTELFQIKEKREKVFETSEEYNKLQTFIKMVKDSLVEKNNELIFIVFLENTANKYQLNQDINILAQKTNKNNNQTDMNFQVTLSGSFESMLNFMKEIETGVYFANITNVALTRVESAIGILGGKNEHPLKEGDTKASFQITVYAY